MTSCDSLNFYMLWVTNAILFNKNVCFRKLYFLKTLVREVIIYVWIPIEHVGLYVLWIKENWIFFQYKFLIVDHGHIIHTSWFLSI